MKKIIFLLPFLVLTAVLSGCGNKQTGMALKAFYYPIDQLREGQVYEYRSVGEEAFEPEYWYFRSFNTDTAVYLTGQYYDPDFNVRQFFREEYVSNGSLMKDYILYQPDTSGQLTRVDTKIPESNGLPFEVPDTQTVFLFKLRWEDPEVPGRTVTLIRNRRFTGFDDVLFHNKSLECAVFEVKEIIETEEEGFQEIRTNGLEKYGKGVGLVYYEKKITEDLFLKYSLHDRYPMQELEQKFEESLPDRER